MIQIDEAKIFNIIETKNPKSIALQAPDGILTKTMKLASKIEKKYNISTFILGDPCWGICDTQSTSMDILGVDLCFNIGHTVSVDTLGKIILIDAFDDVNFDLVIKKVLKLIKNKKVGLCTLSQHLPQIKYVENILKKNGINVSVGQGKGLLNNGQVFGCEFYPVFNIKNKVDLYLFLGQSRFHALGIALSTGKKTLMLDPYFNEISDMEKLVSETFKKIVLSIYKARDATNFGVIVGLKEGQIMLKRSILLKNELEKRGKNVKLIALAEVKNDRLSAFTDIEVFIQSACPRISVEGSIGDFNSLNKLTLSSPQADGLIDLLDGKEINDFLVKNHWL